MGTAKTVRMIIVTEYYSCILLAVICVYSLMHKSRTSVKQAAFRWSVVITFVAIVMTIIAFELNAVHEDVPQWTILVAATLFYIGIAAASASVTAAMFVTMFENRADSKRLRVAGKLIIGIFILEALFIIANLFTGWLFYADAEGAYQTGPAYRIDLVFVTIDYLFIYLFYRFERRRVKRSFRQILYFIPLLAVISGVYQLYYMDTVLTGSFLTIWLIVLFIYGQQQRLNIDPLTELANREAFFGEIDKLTTRQLSYRVMFISLRKYKLINAQHGQRAGDEFLRKVGWFFSSLDPKATAYRFSGVEFAVVIPNMTDEAYEALVRRVMLRFEEPWEADDQTAILSAAFSDIRYPDLAGGVNELTDSLEYAMRLAKYETVSHSVRFCAQLRSEYGRRNYVLAQVERALREDRFFLFIQPVFDCATKRFTGGEVLLRLNEENGRPIPPGEFIPLAIEAGLATKLGWMVLEKTCQFLHNNKDVGWLSVNISSQQNEFDETVRRLETLLEKYRILPESIKLEITERVLLDDLEKAHATMDELAMRGVGVYLDDFGTGYSNLINVLSLPFECVKIDKGLIRGITQNPKSYGMLQTFINGLRSMNMIILAEGVETIEQREIVEQLGIDLIQGYYFARPMPGDEYVWLMRQPSSHEELLQEL